MNSGNLTWVELLTIEYSFLAPNFGLILSPDFNVPNDWSNFTSEALVVLPNGTEILTTAKFSMMHILIKDPSVPIEKRWRVGVSLPLLAKRDVADGSRVLVSPETAERFFRD